MVALGEQKVDVECTEMDGNFGKMESGLVGPFLLTLRPIYPVLPPQNPTLEKPTLTVRAGKSLILDDDLIGANAYEMRV